MGKWSDLVGNLEKAIRPRTFPLAFKLFKEEGVLKNIPKLRRLDYTATWCQVMTRVRTSGQTIVVEEKDLFPNCSATIGLCLPPIEESIRNRTNYWFRSSTDAEAMLKGVYRISPDGYRAAVLAPLASDKFEPDVVVCYGTPAQMVFLMSGLQRIEYKPIQSTFSGESSCSDGLPRCFVTGEPSLMIPCYGERRMGHCAEDELSLAVKPEDFKKICEGVKALAEVGVRYPITPFGCQCDIKPAIKGAYHNIPGFKDP